MLGRAQTTTATPGFYLLGGLGKAQRALSWASHGVGKSWIGRVGKRWLCPASRAHTLFSLILVLAHAHLPPSMTGDDYGYAQTMGRPDLLFTHDPDSSALRG